MGDLGDKWFAQGVVVPNIGLRGLASQAFKILIVLLKNNLEQFEDGPLEFIHLDLSLSFATRRRSAADV